MGFLVQKFQLLWMWTKSHWRAVSLDWKEKINKWGEYLMKIYIKISLPLPYILLHENISYSLKALYPAKLRRSYHVKSMHGWIFLLDLWVSLLQDYLKDELLEWT